ncbi:MAG: efflux RND transporter periplasmic adaptor subunit [Calditrichaeota bacterium]|nr:efflux RND transporter periplasmic adaptor subunit [Calditrichota bacterium]MCB9367117.1 efflux RND transporter periplasmic adaptor subunit [Calditrichota bacterium]MCB9391889.1 efflux RND transporter periplasmic adaptor subunit [Calditrichota bacterium]
MSSIRIIGLTSLAVILLLVAGKVLKGGNGDIAANAYSSVIAVSGFVLQESPFAQFVEETGTLMGNRESTLAALVGGQVENIYADLGDVVKAGQPLLRLDDELLEIEAERAKIAFDKAALDFKRVETLFGDKSVSDSDMEGARLAMKSAEVQYRAAKKTFEDATIRAPFSGTIAARMTEVGQMLDRGQPVFQIVDVSKFKLPVHVSEDEIGALELGAHATLYVEALGDSFPSGITSIGARAMQGARTYPIELTLDAADGLKSGMFARVRISVGEDSSSLVVPRAAALPDVGRTVVFVASGGKAKKVPVKILGTSGDKLSVSGLAIGDTVIVTGNQLLSQGSELNLTLEK